jgi:hypothetical protein
MLQSLRSKLRGARIGKNFMDRQYDLFEVLPDGAPIWRGSASGHDAAILKLRKLAAQTGNEVRVMHLPTKAVIAVINTKSASESV